MNNPNDPGLQDLKLRVFPVGTHVWQVTGRLDVRRAVVAGISALMKGGQVQVTYNLESDYQDGYRDPWAADPVIFSTEGLAQEWRDDRIQAMREGSRRDRDLD